MKTSLYLLAMLVLFSTACTSEYEEMYMRLMDENSLFETELDNKSNVIAGLNRIIYELNQRIVSLESELQTDDFDLEEHMAHGDDWRYWTYNLQNELLNALYLSEDLSNFITLSNFLIDYKSREQEFGKSLSFYNPMNIAAVHNDIELMELLFNIDNNLINAISENYFLVPDNPRPPIVFAIEADSTDAVRFLLENGVP